MAYEQRDNSGTIFVNDRKEKPNHPDRTGAAMVGGKMYRVSGWLKQGSKGQFLSLAFKPAEEKPEAEQRAAPTRPAPAGALRRESMDDEIPFAPEVR